LALYTILWKYFHGLAIQQPCPLRCKAACATIMFSLYSAILPRPSAVAWTWYTSVFWRGRPLPI